MHKYSIGDLERETGISRETLRKWEQRYGFPQAKRNAANKRCYSGSELHQLQKIKRLMDSGHRPGKLLTLDSQQLDELENALVTEPDFPMELQPVLDAITNNQIQLVDQRLQQLLQQGVEQFILHYLPPLLHWVGASWARGELEIFQEHILSERIRALVQHFLIQLPPATDEPHILLATISGEQHQLGILMVEALARRAGYGIVNAGVNVPVAQIAQTATTLQLPIVALTFSAAYPYRGIRESLQQLCAEISPDCEVWIGGDGVRSLSKLPSCVTKFTSLQQFQDFLLQR